MQINSFSRCVPNFKGKKEKSRELRVGEDRIFVDELSFKFYGFEVRFHYLCEYLMVKIRLDDIKQKNLLETLLQTLMKGLMYSL